MISTNTYRDKLLRPLIEEGQDILRSRVRRRIGFYDDRISTWLDRCRSTLLYFQADPSNVDRAITSFEKSLGDSRSIKAVIGLLQDALETRSDPMRSQPDYTSLTAVQIPNLDDVSVSPRLCFVMMPFAAELNPVYGNAIKPALDNMQCDSIRADEVYHPGVITIQIFHYLARAQFCIADISDSNPNVMYELGIAHTLRKPVIIITQDAHTPFDIAHYRYIGYQRDERGLTELQHHLVKAISSLLLNLS